LLAESAQAALFSSAFFTLTPDGLRRFRYKVSECHLAYATCWSFHLGPGLQGLDRHEMKKLESARCRDRPEDFKLKHAFHFSNCR
jgi:hypothetical protein